MFYKHYLYLLIFCCLVFYKSSPVYGIIDPITGTLALAGAFVVGCFWQKPDGLSSFFTSCTMNINIDELRLDMKNNFFGQHIASTLILSALNGNSLRSSSNKKPLVMSFHGRSGCGKNFISDLIANHMFKTEKIKKKRFHLFNSHLLFAVNSNVDVCKEKLLTTIKSALKSCSKNLFVFDELQYLPTDVLDILLPIMENNDDSIDSRNSIFIFLTNSGGDTILDTLLNLWAKGYSREQMQVQDFDLNLQKSAFNENGALKKSRLIDSHVIDHFVPFLPLEKSHVLQCIDAELKKLNKTLTSEIKNKFIQMLPFGPEPEKLFSSSGCKRINNLITTESYLVDF